MGVGRRMKKQGPPPPLDEATISMIKKRKAAEADAKAEGGKKRRKAEVEPAQGNKKLKTKVNGAAVNGKEKKLNGASVPAKVSKAEKKKKTVQKPIVPEPESEDEDDDGWGSGSAPDLDDLMADEFGDLDGVSDGSENSMLEKDDDDEDDNVEKFDEGSVFDSDEEDHPREKMFSDDDESDAEEKLTAANIEGLSRKLDEQRELEEEEARQEMQDSAMQTNIAGERPDIFGDVDSAAKAGVAPSMQLLRTRITDTLRVLGDMKSLGQPDKSRADYMQLLLDDFCTYYGYNSHLAEKLMSLFTPMEAFAFFEANEAPRPVVIRTNTLRTNRRTLAQALINRGVVLEPVGKWSKVGLQVFESAVPLGATPEYLAGHYILQAASSFLPVMALAPQPGERILDMASAPGGKTTYISALMRNTGVVLANDASKPRAKGLIGNIHRLGCQNVIVCNYDAREAFPKILGGFDRILLDAPCTGTGVISKDPSVKTNKTERDFLAIPHMQKQLLLAAIDSTDHHSKTGGYIVYSTCSVTVEENEQVVQYVLRKRPNVKLVDTGLGSFGSEGFISYMGKKFDEKMRLTRRYFPHRENVDGFFVCKLKKTGPSPAGKTDNAVANGAATNGSKADSTNAGESEEEVIDKTPITDEDGLLGEEDNFGPFNEDEDAELIARGERNRLRRKGLNPKAVLGKQTKKADKRDDQAPSASAKEDGSAEEAKSTVKNSKKSKKEKEKNKTDSQPTQSNSEPSTSSPGSKKAKKGKKGPK
ncbi:putative nucleolar RNA methyltransferase [Talaromyces proteolyticus]|uniref:Nucleolar protein 2 n=1 Tax=Talaromyces proteolyticus TaxID=1131652 RepID=A0AAD4KRY5_9EURO|nr:putative nucleolar RNA methyltransferase [Talaromyces proteolyticus]KAH8697826.1 putative nucleolar RNA methyltransferase [Talaromyces proteolyticus]